MLISRLVAARTSEVQEQTTPEPQPGQVLVEVMASGVCTSDLDVWRRGPGEGRPTELGHEIAGRVVASGSPASRWRSGDLVTGLGGSGFATHIVAGERELLPIPPGVAAEHAIGEPIATLEEAISRCGIAPGARVAIVGLGFMGLGLLQLVLNRAPGSVIGVDPSAAARDRAIELGATTTMHPDDVDELAPGRDGVDRRPDVVIEATGVTAGLDTSGRLVRPFGTMCIVGYHHDGTAKLDVGLWYKAVTVVNGFCPDRGRTMRAMGDALDLVASRRFAYAPLITHRFELSEVDAAYAAMEQRDPTFVKAVILP